MSAMAQAFRAPKRYRGFVLTPMGLQKLQAGIQALEQIGATIEPRFSARESRPEAPSPGWRLGDAINAAEGVK